MTQSWTGHNDNNLDAAVALRWSSFLATGYLARNGHCLEVFRNPKQLHR